MITIDNCILYNDDCLNVMPTLEDKSIDLILCDLPYGTTACEWDTVIDFNDLWMNYNRIIKDNGCILLFATEPFASALRMSNIHNYKYDLYWVKEKPTNFLQLKRRAGKLTENICVFYNNQCTYNPQMTVHTGKRVTNSPSVDNAKFNSIVSANSNSKYHIQAYSDNGYRYPNDILKFNRCKLGSTFHPTQKPIDLLMYLIKTYSNENDVVLDNCMGVGSTGVACKLTNRQFIGIEQEEEYFNIAKKRILNPDYTKTKTTNANNKLF